MAKEERRQPELRFKGFTADWEQQKINDVALINPNTSVPDEFEYVDLESVVGTEMISHRTIKKIDAPSRAKRLAKIGDVFFQTVRPYQKNNYHFDLQNDNFVFSTGYAQLRPVGDSYFLFSRLQEDKFVLNVLNMCTGTSYPAINANDLGEIKIFFPKNLKEEIKIGSFLRNLDLLIALHQRKLDRLKDLKEAYLQQIFPEKNHSVPKLRFNNFSELWEQRTVSSMAKKTFGGGTPKTSIENYWNGDFPWIQSSDLKFDNLSDVRPTKFITQEAIDNSATKAVPANSIAIVTRVGVGKLALIPYTYSTSQDFLSLSLLNVDSLFGVYSLYILLQKENKNIQGTSIKGITKSDLLSKKISIPSDFKEQILIGNFLKMLDDTITLHQRKLDSLERLKSSYLQMLFPQ